MKKILPLMMLLSLSTTLLAQESTAITGIDINRSESPYTNVCIAATQSWNALDAAIKEYGFSPLDTNEIYCNDTRLMRFARENLRRDVYIPTKAILKRADSSTETEMCLAALSGEPLPNSSYTNMQTLRCNGRTLESFVNRYGKHEIVDIL